MDAWCLYENRAFSNGETLRKAMFNREKRYIKDKARNNLSYKRVKVNGVETMLEIVRGVDRDLKTIHSMPGEDIVCGAEIEWGDTHWLVTEKDFDNELYTTCTMRQCNYLIKWVDSDHVIHEKWCIIEDSTKYMTGDLEDRYFVVTRGDSRIAMTIQRDEDTVKLGRTNRFLIDDAESNTVLAYDLTKPLKVGHVYDGNGVLSFVLSETETTLNDNVELMIPDYYLHFKEDGSIKESHQSEPIPDSPADKRKGGWT